jgi:predicted small secreted protein
MKRNYFLMFTVLFLTTLIVGCNMLKGAGKDVENAGQSIQKTVDHNN